MPQAQSLSQDRIVQALLRKTRFRLYHAKLTVVPGDSDVDDFGVARAPAAQNTALASCGYTGQYLETIPPRALTKRPPGSDFGRRSRSELQQRQAGAVYSRAAVTGSKSAHLTLERSPLFLIRFLGQLDCPHTELLYNFRFNSGLRKNAAFTCLFA
jgi:hypothetical protein